MCRIPGELAKEKKGKLMAAFTHHRATCRAANMGCHSTYYTTDEEGVFFLFLLLSGHNEHVTATTASTLLTGCDCSLVLCSPFSSIFLFNHKCISHGTHVAFHPVLFYLWNLWFQPECISTRDIITLSPSFFFFLPPPPPPAFLLTCW